MHTRRLDRPSGATAQRLLDGGDGPPPLPQLLAAATAPATPAELRGESAARAAFRTSVHSAPLPHPRRSTVRTTTTIIVAKAIAAIALTASTAGGIALATTSTPADPDARTMSESAATGAAASPSLVVTTPTPTEAELDDSDAAADALAAEPSGGPGGAGTAVRTTPEAKAPHPTGLCRASSNIATDHPGKAAASPAFADLHCDDAEADAGTGTEATRPTGHPTVAPGNRDRRTGKPDTASRPEDGTDTGNKPEKAAHLDKSADDHADQTRADDEDPEKSSQNRQNG
jgi:hypothetical protein